MTITPLRGGPPTGSLKAWAMGGEPFVLEERMGLVLLAPKEAPPGLLLRFTTRLGGVSRPPFSSLNLSLAVGDDPKNVLENRRRLARALGFNLCDFVAAKQVHGANFHVVTGKDRGRGSTSLGEAIPDVDALLTAEPELPLLLTFADCAPVAVYDPEAPALGAIHAGWRGALSGVVERAVRAMASELGAKPERCVAFVLPRIGPSHLRLSPDVVEEFLRIWPGSALPDGRVSLTRAVVLQLLRAGISRRNIFVSRLCTFCRRRLFFSERREKPTGRMAMVASIMGAREGERCTTL